MKKYILTLLVLLLPLVLNAQGLINSRVNRFGLSFYAGANLPVIGNMTSDIKTFDYVYTGPQYGFSLSYQLSKSVGVEANVMSVLNFVQNKYRANGKDPAFSTYSYSVNGIYNFSWLFKNTNFSPYIKGGIGLYHWSHLDDAPWYGGKVINTNGVEHKGSSFGFNIGIGTDYMISKHFSVGLVLDYNMYFPKDEQKFGNDFAGQGNFTPQLKLTYLLPSF